MIERAFFAVFFLSIAGGPLWMVASVLVTIGGDPHRWSKPDVYLCLIATAYATGWGAASITLPTVRDLFFYRSAWWLTLLNPGCWFVYAFSWVWMHNTLSVFLMLAFMAWTALRQAWNAPCTLRIDAKVLSAMTRDAAATSASSRR